MATTFEQFYDKLKEKVINIVKKQEVEEGNLQFDKIVGNVLKDIVLADLDLKRKQQVPRDKQNYPIKNILYRDDSKTKIEALSK